MLISHEVPIEMLEQSKSFNDYDYCLLHLIYEYPQYKEFYKNSKRKVLLDNSLYELGDALSNDKLASGVLEINPTWYVIPDCLNNKDITIDRFERFVKDYSYLPGLRIGVVQGNTVEDFIECYKFMSANADKIAIPFDSKAFEEFRPNENKLISWCKGRRDMIGYLCAEGIWNIDKPHHLLGCSLAKEFKTPLYRMISIESIDTSNPIVAAIENKEYHEDGLDDKPKTKLCDLINHKMSLEEIELVDHNVKAFRRICDGK